MTQRILFLCLFFIAFTFGDLATAVAQTPFQVVAVSGDVGPDGVGNLNFVDVPTINNAGQVAFLASLENTTADQIVVLGDAGGLTSIFRRGDAAPNGNGILASPFDISINENGQVALQGSLFNTANGSRIFRYDGATGLTSLVSINDLTPSGNGTLSRIAFVEGFDFNNQGQVSFGSEIDNTTGGSSDDFGIFRSDSEGTVEIAREGTPGPGNNEQFGLLRTFTFSNYPLNNSGQVAFHAVVDTEGGSSSVEGIFVGDGTAPATAVARAGDAIIGSNATILGFGGFVLPRQWQRSDCDCNLRRRCSQQ